MMLQLQNQRSIIAEQQSENAWNDHKLTYSLNGLTLQSQFLTNVAIWQKKKLRAASMRIWLY